MTAVGRISIPKLGGVISDNRDQLSLVLYVVLISLQFALSYIGIELPLIFRLAVLVILFLSLINNIKWTPFVFTLFWGTSLLSPLPVLPTEEYYMLLFALAIGAINLGIKKVRRNRFESWLLITVVYFLTVALITIDSEMFTSPLFFLIPVALVVSSFVKNEDDILRLMLALMLMSLFLAALFLLKRDDFVQSYKSFGIDRSGWTNANMFGGCVAVGLVCAVAYILNSLQQNRNLFLNIVAITTFLVTLPALVLNASRGSLLSAAVVSVMLLFVSKIKVSYKIIVTVLIIGFTVYLYNSGIFELLETRMGEENLETGGNRTPIWEAKFKAFGESGLLSWIFGVGQPRLRYLGVFYSTHNDFITALIGYGITGFVLFMYFLFSPFRVAKRCRIQILILTSMLLLEGMVLEPIFRGLLPFYMYYIILYKYSILSRSQS